MKQKLIPKLKKITQRFFWLLFFSFFFLFNILKHPLRTLKKLLKYFSIFFIFTLYALKHPLKTSKKLLKWFLATWPRRLLASFLIILFIITPLSFLFSRNKVEAAWWNDSWQYRKPISVTNSSGGILTDFQVKILSNVDLSADITAGKIQADLDDLRFTDINGKLLPYWIEDTTTTSVDVWAKMPSIPTTGATVYMYYGNVGAVSKNDTSIIPKSCSGYNAFLGSGLYYINPDEDGNDNPFQVYCDMATNSGGWMLVASWNTSQEWTKTSVSTADVFGTTAKDAVSSHFGNVSMNNFRILASDAVSTTGSSAYADWYYHYNTAITWKEVWAPTSNTGGHVGDGYQSTTPRQSLKPFNYSYNIKFSYQVTQTYNNLSDWGYTGAATSGCLPNYWNTLTIPGGNFGVYSTNYYTGSDGANCASPVSDGTLGVCPSNIPGCITGQDVGTTNAKIGYDDATARARFGATDTTDVGDTVGVDATTKLWWFIREDATPVSKNISVATPSTEEKGTGPVAYWSFDEGYGTNTNDTTANNNDGTLTNMSATPSPTSGWQTEDQCVSGKCLAFDGTDDWVISNSSVPIGTSDFTVSSWVNSLVDGTAIIGTVSGGGGDGFMLYTTYGGSGVYFSTRDYPSNTTVSGTTSISDGKWHHVVGVRNSTNLYIYVDGILYASGSGTVLDIGSGDNPPRIGAMRSDQHLFKGKIDEPKIYNYARSATQIKLDYNAGLAGTGGAEGASVTFGGKSQKWLTDGLVGHWKMDESSWGSVVDSSGNGNNGTANGSVALGAGKFGNSASYNGTDGYISVPSNSNFSFGTGDFAITLWANLNNTSGYQHFFNMPDQDTFCLKSYDVDNKIYFYSSGFNTYSDISATYNNGEWSYITLIRKDQTAYIYVNGVLKGSKTGFTNNVTANTIKIGEYASEYTNGKLDEMRVYNRALSPQEVSDLYHWAPGPVAYWNMEEGSGTTANDTSGNGYTGTITGSTWTSGKIGKALNFSDTNDKVQMASPVISGTGDFTLEAWINRSATGSVDSVISNYGGSPCASGIEFYIAGDKTITYVGSGVTGATTISANTWYHVATTRSNGLVKIYVNGKEDASGTLAGSIGASCNLAIGNGPNYTSEKFEGKIDQAQVYNYARTPDQIKEDMLGRSGSSVSDKSTVGYWKFDEGQGTTVNNSGSGGSTNNGTITGATWINQGKFGKALSFDGVDDYIYAYTGQDAAMETTSFWYKHIASQSGTILANNVFGDSSAATWFLLSGNNLTAYYLSNTVNETSLGSTTLTVGNWYHITSVYDMSRNYAAYYVDGIKIAEINTFSPYVTHASGSRLSIGSAYHWTGSGNTPHDFVSGQFDEVKIYNFALTADEVALDYNQGKSIQLGSSGTTVTGAPSNSADRAYCPPGDMTANCGPIAEWKLDEKNGTTGYDTSGNNRNLSFGNTPTWITGKVGAALDFDRGDYAYQDWTDFTLSNQTIEFWVKADSLSGGWEDLVGTYLGTDLNRFHFNTGTSAITWYNIHGSCGTLTSGVVPVVGQWYHVTGTTDGTNAKIYINGQYKNSLACSGSHTATGVYLAGPSGETFDGQIDDVKIYDYARTPAQIAWDYNRGAPVGWWKMDEGEGTTINDSAGKNSVGTAPASNWTTGLNGTAIRVDSSYLSLPVSVKAPLTTTFWFKPTTNTDSVAAVNNAPLFFWYQDESNYIHYSLYSYGGSTPGVPYLQPRGYVTHYYHQAYNYLANQWYFAVFKMETNQMWLYIYKDGVLVNSIIEDVNVGYASYSFSSLRLYDFGSECNYDDIRVYNYIITDQQLKQVMGDGAINFK